MKNATFFPAHWTGENVVNKIHEAYKNFFTNKMIPKLEKNGKYVIRASTDEGITIQMYITKNGQITTAYPIIE